MIVSGITSLIYLAKINMLHLLEKKFKTVFIPHTVWEEFVERGKLEEYSDAYLVEEAINEGWMSR